MLSVIQSMILGIIQGLTEWFPVSSSGHLALYQNIFDVDVPVLYDVYLHLGTLIVLFIFFWKDITRIFKDVFTLKLKTKNSILAWYIISGSIATAVIGLTFYDFFSSTFYDLRYIGFGFLFSAMILYFSGKAKQKRDSINLSDSLVVGFFQAIALVPGVSRSGATIGAGMIKGAGKTEVARFSFLLSIPAVLGAAIIQSLGYFGEAIPFLRENLAAVAIGILFAAATGYLTLKGLIKIIEKGVFHKFSWYCLAIGIFTLIIAFFPEYSAIFS